MIIDPTEVELKNQKRMTLKSPAIEDAEKVLTHIQRIFHESYQNLNHPKNSWDEFSVEDEESIIQEFNASPTKFMLSAFDQGQIVGNLTCTGVSGEFLKHNARIGMGMERTHQNIGLGTALLRRTIEVCHQQNLHRLELNVRTFNKSGIALYEKIGFRQAGLLKDAAFVDGKFCDEFIYELIL